MFIIDSRADIKEVPELMNDKVNIIKAVMDITGLKYYHTTDENRIATNNFGKRDVELAFEASIIDSPLMSGKSEVVCFYRKSSLFKRKQKPESLMVVGYGDVVYLKDDTNTVYTWVRGTVVLKQEFDERVDLWDFALHVQDSLKTHSFKQFKRNLKKDKMFWRKTKII